MRSTMSTMVVVVLLLGALLPVAAETSSWAAAGGQLPLWMETNRSGPAGWLAIGFSTEPESPPDLAYVGASRQLTVAAGWWIHVLVHLEDGKPPKLGGKPHECRRNPKAPAKCVVCRRQLPKPVRSGWQLVGEDLAGNNWEFVSRVEAGAKVGSFWIEGRQGKKLWLSLIPISLGSKRVWDEKTVVVIGQCVDGEYSDLTSQKKIAETRWPNLGPEQWGLWARIWFLERWFASGMVPIGTDKYPTASTVSLAERFSEENRRREPATSPVSTPSNWRIVVGGAPEGIQLGLRPADSGEAMWWGVPQDGVLVFLSPPPAGRYLYCLRSGDAENWREVKINQADINIPYGGEETGR